MKVKRKYKLEAGDVNTTVGPAVNKPCECILKLSKPLFAHLQKEKKMYQ